MTSPMRVVSDGRRVGVWGRGFGLLAVKKEVRFRGSWVGRGEVYGYQVRKGTAR